MVSSSILLLHSLTINQSSSSSSVIAREEEVNTSGTVSSCIESGWLINMHNLDQHSPRKLRPLNGLNHRQSFESFHSNLHARKRSLKISRKAKYNVFLNLHQL